MRIDMDKNNSAKKWENTATMVNLKKGCVFNNVINTLHATTGLSTGSPD